ncbi:kinesin-like protein KIF15 isoform X2 [Mya arenaria]|uniref:kinesin-like protein KIF15 isoform X2 n=1 Tax=Mya arenaria TaxID=6604 RepID=UPI0022E0BFC6|nr:kinesin-like protein KIF15 isoform X2 [Mya arenaria]
MSSLKDSSSVDSECNIQVFIRIRPPASDESTYSRVVDVAESNTQVLLKQDQNPRVFSFDYVADVDSTQDNIFNRLGKKVIENCVAGYNGTIFAYGQTGSGKTFTMLGPSEDADNFHHEMRGVIPRSFEYLFQLINKEKEKHGDTMQFLCKCSFLEIYNEQIFDLLEPSANILHLRESLKTGVYVSGLSEQVVSSAGEAYEVLQSSWQNRKVASTSMNRESSRSHAVFCLQIESKERNGSVENIKTSQLNLVDLAGSERQKDTQARGLRLKEAGSINKSLSNLGNVIMALVRVSVDNKKRYIPYRDSKLTFLLRDSLGGNSKTSLIACVHPGAKCFGETLSTLQFAKRAKMIKNKAILNENSMGNITQLQEEIRALKEELQMFKSGTIPSQPSQAVSEESMPVLKEMFLQAMYLRQKADAEKQELVESIDNLKDIIQKKDKALQTNKMIIKFRDNNVKRLEDKLKGKEPQDSQIDDLQKEIAYLQAQVDSNPTVVKFSMEVRQLKASLANLKEEPGTVESILKDQVAVNRLEQMFRTLLSEQQTNSEESEVTPSKAETVSTATLEKLRSKNTDLTAKVEEISEQLEELKSVSDKREKKLEGELEVAHKQIEELEGRLKAKDTLSRIEREALQDIHMQTVKTMLTPKKDCYKLRNRTVSKAGSLNDTILFESPECPSVAQDEGILGEDMPEEVQFQETEALLDQIKTLQGQLGERDGRIEEYEEERVRQNARVLLLENQLKNTQEFLDQEKQRCMNLQEEIRLCEPRVKRVNEEKEAACGENQDLRLMLQQADRQLKEAKDKLRAVESDRDVAISKLTECQPIIEQLSTNLEKLQEENEQLTSSLDDQCVATEFHRSRNCNYEKDIEEKSQIIAKLQRQVQAQEALNQLQEKQQLQQHVENQKNRIEALESTVDKHKEVLKERDNEIQTLDRKLQAAEEETIKLFGELKKKSEEIYELRQSLETEGEKSAFYQKVQEEHEGAIADLEREIADIREEHIMQLGKKQAQIDLNEGFAEEIVELEGIRAQLQDENENLKVQVSKLESGNSQEQLDKIKAEMDELKAENIELRNRLFAIHEQSTKIEQERKEIAQQAKRNSTVTESEIQATKQLLEEKDSLQKQLETYFSVIEEVNGILKTFMGIEAPSQHNLPMVIQTLFEEREDFHEKVGTIAGHSNRKQKIHLLAKYKEIIYQREQEVCKLKNQQLNCRCELKPQKHEKQGLENEKSKLLPYKPSSILKEKENLPTHKTFLSGEFTGRVLENDHTGDK